jgi:hypothetical protein
MDGGAFLDTGGVTGKDGDMAIRYNGIFSEVNFGGGREWVPDIFTYSLWVNPDKNRADGILIYRYGRREFDIGVRLELLNGEPLLSLGNGTDSMLTVKAGVHIPKDRWTHIVASRDSKYRALETETSNTKNIKSVLQF